MTTTPNHPFASEAPDAAGYFTRMSVDRYVLPDGAISGSSVHVWLLVNSEEVTLMSTPVFRRWLDEAFRPSRTPDPDRPTIYVIAADRPDSATPLLMLHWDGPSYEHVLVAVENGRTVPFARYPRLDGR